MVHCANEAQAANARRLGLALVRRGGPALIVGYFPKGEADPYLSLYGDIVHDKPLDDALSWLKPDDGLGPFPTLFAGAGREDMLRVSSVALSLLELKRGLDMTTGYSPSSPGGTMVSVYVKGLLLRTSKPADVTAVDRILRARARLLKVALRSFQRDWNRWKFSLHEGEGLVPMSVELQEMRTQIGVHAPVAWNRLQRIQVAAAPRRRHGVIRAPRAGVSAAERQRNLARAVPPTTALPPAPRFLNVSLWREPEGKLLKKLKATESLRRGEVYQLGVQIGPRDAVVITVGATAILEETFKWEKETAGAWIEVGVTGIDFEVLGDPVQEVWLPREGSSEINVLCDPHVFCIRRAAARRLLLSQSAGAMSAAGGARRQRDGRVVV